MKSDDARAGEHAGAEAVPLVATVVRGDEAGVRAHQHHPLEADVEHTGALGHELAERGEEQRHADEDRPGQERREAGLGEGAARRNSVLIRRPASASAVPPGR